MPSGNRILSQACEDKFASQVVRSCKSLRVLERLQVGIKIDNDLAVVAALFLTVLPACVPVCGFDANEHAHNHNQQINDDGQPLLGFQMVGESTKEQPAQFWTPLVGKETLMTIARGTAFNGISVPTGLVSAFLPFLPLAK